MTDLGLDGRRAVVTGASRGIGRAIAGRLAGEGMRVLACHVTPGAAGDLEAVLSPAGGLVVQADLSTPDGVGRLAAAARDRLGGVDVLVNNAGVVSHRPIADLDSTEWHRVLDTNLTSMYLVIQALLPLMSDGGAIVNVSSAVALVGQPGIAHYTAAKAGVLGLTRSLCKELGPRRIRVNSLSPGVIDTDQAAGSSPERRAAIAARTALGRLGEPADVEGACLFLVSDLARFVTGVNLVVDGGLS